MRGVQTGARVGPSDVSRSEQRSVDHADTPPLAQEGARTRLRTSPGGCAYPAMFKVLAFLAALGSVACGLLIVRDLLQLLTLQQSPTGARVATLLAVLAVGSSLGAAASLLQRNR